MAYERKTYDVWEIQGYYEGFGWDFICEEESAKAAREQLKCYNENEVGVPHRIVMRRIRKAG